MPYSGGSNVALDNKTIESNVSGQIAIKAGTSFNLEGSSTLNGAGSKATAENTAYKVTNTDSPTAQTNTNATTASGGTTTPRGMRITIGASNLEIISFTKDSACTATRGIIKKADNTIIATGTFSGDVCTFNTPVLLKAGTNYILECDSNGSSYNDRQSGVSGIPLALSLLTYAKQTYNGVDQVNSTDNVKNISVREVPTINLPTSADVGTIVTLFAPSGNGFVIGQAAGQSVVVQPLDDSALIPSQSTIGTSGKTYCNSPRFARLLCIAQDTTFVLLNDKVGLFEVI